MKNKKILISVITLIVVLGGLGISSIFMLSNNDNKLENNTAINDVSTSTTTNELTNEPETTTVSVPEDNYTTTEPTTEATTKKESTTTNNKANEKKTTSTKESSSKKTTTKKENNTKKTTSNNNGKLPKCSSNDPELINRKKKYQEFAKYSMLFESLKEAKEYGDYAMHLSYGYWYSPQPVIKYEGDGCYSEFYEVELYVPDLTCGDNDEYHYKSFYLKPTPKSKLIDAYKYVTKNLGWNCSDRIW